MSDAATFARAQQSYAAGELDKAETLLTGLARARPADVSVMVLLGLTIARRGRAAEALEWLERARAGDPAGASVWQGLGLVYRQLGRLHDARTAYERAIALDASDAGTYVNLGVVLKAMGDLPRAVGHLERAIALAPRLRAAYFNLGNCLVELRDLDRAGSAYMECLRLNSRDEEAVLGVVRVFCEQQRHELAEKTLKSALKTMPGRADLTAALGAILHDTGRLEEGRSVLRGVLDSHPDNVRALRHLGNIERDLGDWQAAAELYRRALQAEPANPDALLELAAALGELGDKPGALAALDRVQQFHAHDADIRQRRAIALLNECELAQGWAEYAATSNRSQPRFAHLPKLDGLSFAGRKVVLWGDQGIGDEIIYGSMLMDLRSHAANIVCEVDRRLVPLFQRGIPELRFVPRSFMPEIRPAATAEDIRATWRAAPVDERLRGVTHQAALSDLGQWLRTDIAQFPVHDGYLRADPARIEASRRQLAPQPGVPVVGVSWRSRNRDYARFKSIELRTIAEALPDMRLMSLQYGDVSEDIAAVRRDLSREVEVFPDLDYFNDIEGLAALIMACDVVVTVSSVTAHLAGALGKRAALLCPRHGRPWYWLRELRDTPWYPGMRLFRQAADGDWGAALRECRSWIL